MTETLASRTTIPGVTIRTYRPFDHSVCRRLWAELTEHQLELHHDSQLSGRDLGAGFEDYLTRLDLSGMWVADEAEEGVVGFVGLVLDGRGGAVEPMVVSTPLRGRGIGRALLGRVVQEARSRGLSRLIVSPSARDIAALRTLHSAGFADLASVTVSYDLAGQLRHSGEPEGSTINLHDLRYRV